MELDELDARLVHALQVEPRAAWTDLAPIVGADPATLARRWNRLRREGIAWTSGYLEPPQVAIVELDHNRSGTREVPTQLTHHPEVLVVDVCSGSRDLLLIVTARDISSLTEFVTGSAGLQGFGAVRTHLISDLLSDGSDWRLRALSPTEVEQLPKPPPPRARAARTVPDDLASAIARAIWVDGRASVASIAASSGFAPQRVSDAIAVLRASGELRLRTDVARAASSWPIYAWYFVEAPARTVESARTRIVAVPEVRLAAVCASRYNLILAVWLRTLADVNRFEIALGNALDGARVADRAVVLRMVKQVGRLLGPDTRAIGDPPNDPPPAR
ncbi:MAG: Lrp/AsnC family transcriptional regulator [Microlunatus sp.]